MCAVFNTEEQLKLKMQSQELANSITCILEDAVANTGGQFTSAEQVQQVLIDDKKAEDMCIIKYRGTTTSRDEH